ncbi:ATP-binding protein (plasmid) [Kovacikia minuta CCNUW1]|uniref:slr1658 superfamily regulator n=1 Tax=Kovacikia minuta TaxID=2931930 RepID=UPI001CCA4249|nr:ATP-binding protein [Kovacikia minuta]UBF30412.1 ATP-binding protein [Kovacikia minuta CCNUW1]
MVQILGDFSEHLPVSKEYLTIVFSPSSAPLQQRWHNNGLSADFMADYFAAFFPRSQDTVSKINSKVEVKSAVSFIANELLENAMKFNDSTTEYPISITLQLHTDSLVFLATNSLKAQTVDHFQSFIQEIMTADPGDLLIRQLEKNAEEDSPDSSGLGLLTMMSDYLAKIGWKFETVQEDPEIITVTTMVYLMM